MTKKQNTLVFILVGTICNLILSLLFIIVLFIIGVAVLNLFTVPLSEKVLIILMPISFVGGIIVGMIVYQKLTMFIVAKFQLENKLEPLFVRKYRKNKK